jgi:hypothetical protein
LEQGGGLPIALAFEVTESDRFAIMIGECHNGFAQQLLERVAGVGPWAEQH